MRLEPALQCAVAAVLGGMPLVCPGSPDDCAEVKARIEKRLAVKGVVDPPLKIVPRGLAGGSRILGTCEGGTQRIVQRPAPPASGPSVGKRRGQPDKV